ncbi:MAG: Adenylate cyclase [Candidatus Ozemobacter sibiricus]|uniref:Adenylate cyclase n=1 Tax=Candidatus Ozemobacter sibiricus TaxID=2268124 RepID=A0A367ZRP2_9BACT|nr:MAG: Adenylate cyclase [Candidatus Ozemobacter sibiricus]
MRQAARLALPLVFILVPGMTLLWSGREARLRQAAALEAETRRQLAWQTDRVRASLNLEAQVNLVFDRLGQRLGTGTPDLPAVRAWYRQVLARGLPPHEVQIFACATAPSLVFRACGDRRRAAGAHPGVVRPGAGPGSASPPAPPARLEMSGPRGGRRSTRLLYEIARFLSNIKAHSPVEDTQRFRERVAATYDLPLPLGIQGQREGCLQIFRRPGGRQRGFLWKTVRRRWLILCVFDLDRPPGRLLADLLAASWTDRSSGLALLPSGSDRLQLSPVIRAHPDLRRLFCQQVQEWRIWRAERASQAPPPRSRAAAGRFRPFLYGTRFAARRWGEWLIGACPAPPGSAYRGFLVMPLPSPGPLPLGQAAWMAGLALAMLAGIFLTVEQAVFGRGPALGVSTVLWGGFLCAALLPLSLLDHLLASSIDEEIAARRQQAAHALHDDLVGLDEDGRFNMASYTHFLKSLTPLERLATIAGQDASLASPATCLQVAFQRLVDRNCLQFYNFLGVGTDGTVLQFRNVDSRVTRAASTDPLTRRLVRRARDQFKRWGLMVADGAAGAEPPGKELMTGVQEDLVTDVLLHLAGPEPYLNLIYQPHRLFELRFNYVSSLALETLTTRAGRPYLLTSWFWNRKYVDREFLKRRLAERATEEERRREGRFLMVFDGYRTQMTPILGTWDSLAAAQPTLAEMSRSSYFTRIDARLVDPADPGHPVLETLPGRSLNAVLGGRQDTAFLEGERAALLRQARIWLAAALGLAIGLAIFAGWSFQRPLAALFDAVRRIQAQDFTVRLSLPRDDEFGSLARAFNQMARGLEEGSILRRFVSRSVREAVAGTHYDLQASTGQRTDVTVAFSSLAGFDAYQAAHDPGEVFALLAAHLDIISAAVHEIGGDIDKVIGDKIMLVFRHDGPGGAAGAARQALAVVARARQVWRQQGLDLSLAAGINSGPVVAGIIGAGRIRLDQTVIGDPVNLASRLACLAQTTGGTQVVIAAETLALAGPGYPAEPLPFRAVRGKTREIQAFLLRED